MKAAALAMLTICAWFMVEPPVAAAGRRGPDGKKTRIVIDSDANNELDDQHAIAYVLLSPDRFDIEGITVNKTFGGGGIRQHAEEAERIVKLCGLSRQVRVYEGATGSFEEIRATVHQPVFDGSSAVDFIIARAKAEKRGTLVILAIGKLTNIGLALCKDPSIGKSIRIVWLGTNYPDPGEYNFENDTSVVNYILSLSVRFEVATVRYGKSTGTAAVQASVDDIRLKMRGKGPRMAYKVAGRHGGEFDCFGDYSVDLFEHVKEKNRSLYDMAAAAIVKNPGWADSVVIRAPRFKNGIWIDQPRNPRTVVIWENFDREKIMNDFYRTMDQR
ncbi:MAG TPA: nucleoside hydrolase [Bacteroidota bacterium]